MKTCTKCKTEKSKDEFWPDKRRNSLLPHCKDCKNEARRLYFQENDYHKKRYWNNRDKERERHLIKKYNISWEDYYRLLEKQNGKCAICGKPEPENKSLDVDHNHETKEVRGLLCTNCNRMIGHAHDSEERLKKAADYLSSRKSQQPSSRP